MLFYAVMLELVILLTFWVCLGVWQRDSSASGRSVFVGLGLAVILWCLGDLFYYRGTFDEVIADRIKYAGALALPAMWTGVAAHAARLDLARRVPWFPLALLAPLVVPYGLLFSESWSWLFMRTEQGDDFYGPLWWVVIAYAYSLILLSSGAIFASAWKGRVPGHWTRRLLLGVAPLLPLVGNAWYVATGIEGAVDPTSLLFGVTSLVLRSAVFSGGLLQALPVSQHDLIEQLPLGVVVTDRRGVVIALNPAAEHRLGVPEAHGLGRTLDAVLSDSGCDVRAVVTPVLAHEREVGQLVLIDPPEKG